MATKDSNSLTNGFTASNGSIAQSTGRASMSPLRQRPLGRASTFADPQSPRRSSNLSESVDDAKQSIRSSTDDLLRPRVQKAGLETSKESSHWHSAPLGLALFPALGGLLFKNGSAVVTDLTLLGIAAVFLNWSVRLPWDWYRSAQAIYQGDSLPPPSHSQSSSDTIVEEDDQDSPSEFPTPPEFKPPPPDPSQTAAAAELRTHELLALLACFIFPLVSTWLLHHIRSQLSRPSEGLVSNYNLTIFLLASELRPLSHLIKLIQARTLHLQRIASPTATDVDLSTLTPQSLSALTSRLDDLEAHIASTQSPDPKPTANGNLPLSSANDIINSVRKSLNPDIEALNRAVRRYEKRATLLSMQTESRLVDLESRLSDAITLAAAAERNVSNVQRGI
ncbi:MAG: hypothetical protein Q9195_001149 [Heterodermia aff. obscurata]